MLGNTLKAPELLRNKGIRFETWKKWDKTAEILPSTGLKQYEPNNSWLQNKQIEKGLKDRKDVLGIERVERSSQLASAEWLPQESRARVTKKSGQEWTSFGLEENLELYLVPEEALLLLELNCLELTWEGVAMSLQQAHSILLGSDQTKCSIDEYRVYSHLVRQGYRLQRFRYEDGSTPQDSIPPRRSSTLKRKKLIHDPLDGFGMSRDRIQPDAGSESTKDSSTVPTKDPNDVRVSSETASNRDFESVTYDKTSRKSNERQASDQTDGDTASGSNWTVPTGMGIDESVDRTKGTLEDRSPVIGNGEKRETKRHSTDELGVAKRLASELYDNGFVNLPGPSNVETKKIAKNSRDSKLQIISDETFVGDFKIISQWPGTRIHRNVKWMPKRNLDKTPHPIVEKNNDSGRIENIVDNGASSSENEKSRITGAPSSSEVATDVDVTRGGKRGRTQEVIEVSDDEIEELPQKMSRIEMLNRFPNVISERFCAKQIPRRYLPPNVCPRNISNLFIKSKGLNEDDRANSDVYEISRAGQILYGDTACHYDSTPVTDLNEISTNDNYRKEFSRQGSQLYKDLFESRTTYQRFCDQAAPWALQTSKGVFGEQGHIAVQLGIYTNVAVAQSIWAKSSFLRPGLLHRQNLWTNMSCYHSRQNLVNLNVTRQRSRIDPRRMWDTSRYPRNNNHSNARSETGESSFKIVPGASSWAETKAKWLDERTITIEDEDCTTDENAIIDESEVKVVARPVKPLVGRQNATSLAQVYKSLQLVKPATSRDFRRSRKAKRTNSYRISYDLYSTGHNFRKANPGAPMYRIAVLRSKDTPLIELADIVRLQNDSKETPVVLACTSQTCVTFVELGTVRIPDLHQNNHIER